MWYCSNRTRYFTQFFEVPKSEKWGIFFLVFPAPRPALPQTQRQTDTHHLHVGAVQATEVAEVELVQGGVILDLPE